MQDPNQSDLLPEDPICVCGYSKVGLPETDHPCPECGSTKLAVYQSSWSHTGWQLAVVGACSSFTLSVVVIGLRLTNNIMSGSHLSWYFISVLFGLGSLFHTAISMVKREPKRKSIRNVGLALVSGLLVPVAILMIWIIDSILVGFLY